MTIAMFRPISSLGLAESITGHVGHKFTNIAWQLIASILMLGISNYRHLKY
jgi:hypothetical protein